MKNTNRTKIEYLDYTWNPTAGCSGKGCAVRKVCWAYKMAKRLGRYCETCPSFVPHVHFDRFEEPLKVKKPSIIGTSFMGDFYDDGISNWVRKNIYMYMEKSSWHKFLVLTKQPQNIDDDVPKNLWIGVTVNKKDDLWRIGTLRHTNVSMKVISFEPLLEKIQPDLTDIDWIIIGGQTRPKIIPQYLWILEIIQAAKNNYPQKPVFLKNNIGSQMIQHEYPGQFKSFNYLFEES